MRIKPIPVLGCLLLLGVFCNNPSILSRADAEDAIIPRKHRTGYDCHLIATLSLGLGHKLHVMAFVLFPPFGILQIEIKLILEIQIKAKIEIKLIL